MLYGKWRPQGFDEVVGQDHIVTTLRNALIASHDFLANGGSPRSDPLAHAYLFSGPRGTGKTTTARILAKAVNCLALAAGDPCGKCAPCVAIQNGSALDLIEMDAASNRGIDDIRELRDKIAFAPSDLQKKVYLLDEVHMLTDGAFNALLKTLEEPPPHAIFILATTELHKVPATIVSRCQRYDFHRVPNEAVIRRLQAICDGEGFSFPREGLAAISVQSRGGMRDAITLLEQAAARYGHEPSYADVLAALGLVQDERSARLVKALIEEDLAEALAIAREVADDGVDVARFTRTAVDILRRILTHVIRGVAFDDSEHPEDIELAQAALGRAAPVRMVVNAIQELAKADFRLDPASPVPLEIACAATILQPEAQVAPAAASGAEHSSAPIRRQPSREQQAGGNRATDAPAAPATPEDRFLRALYDRCTMANVKVGAWLNGSCEVLAIGDDSFELGFYHDFHLDKVKADGRAIIEEQAGIILGRPVRLEARRIDRERSAPRRPRSGHLAEAAIALGATPVAKE